MKLRLIKSWTNPFGRKYPVGQIMQTDRQLGKFLLDNKFAKEYEETQNVKQKVKSDFFKPKN